MVVRRLAGRGVARMWGRRRLPDGFEGYGSGAEPIGEIWFEAEAGAEPELLVKYLFTSERLSIQVHPDDYAARAAGHRCGKDEAWLVLEAEPGAVIGLGLRETVSADAVRQAALDGSIEPLIDWRPVRAGDFFYSPAGTIHAIGGGLSLIEVQQNVDLTYRLYDYGRPRELHLDEAVAVARPEPWSAAGTPRRIDKERMVLAEGGCFVVERWRLDGERRVSSQGGELLLIPVAGSGRVDELPLKTGDTISLTGEAVIEASGGLDLLVAYGGGAVRERLLPSASA